MGLHITETASCWEVLSKTRLPIFMYGMGLGAEKILKVFEEKGITCSGFFASEGFVRGHEFKGHLVHTLKEVEEKVDDFIVVLAFAAGYEPLYSQIMDISKRHMLIVPDVPVAGDGLFDHEYFLEHRDLFEKTYDLLADDLSRKTYEAIINFKISGKPCYLDMCTSPRSEVYDDIVKLKDGEVFVDLGAYKGDTAEEFVKACDRAGVTYKSIYALEPNRKNYNKLLKNTEGYHDISCFNAAAWECEGKVSFTSNEGRMARISDKGEDLTDAMSVDSFCEQATIIKLDVEGAELQALNGASRNLEGGAQVMCALYHRNEDMFRLPLFIHEKNPDLKLYIRHELYIPAWETNLYAVKGIENGD